MKKIGKKQAVQMGITAFGAVLIILIAWFCYTTVQDTIIENEQESIVSLARVSAKSLKTTLQSKSNLVYAAMSGDMADIAAIEQNLLKIGERERYIPLEESKGLKKWEQEMCEQARTNPGEVIGGPVFHSEEGSYMFCLTKAVYMEGSIAGYVQIQLNLDEIYREEQALSSLYLGNQGYCIVKDINGATIMAGNEEKKEEISFETTEEQDCLLAWSYEVEGGTPKRVRKLVAYDTMSYGEGTFIICVIENYDDILKPIERISLYFALLGIVLLLWVSIFVYRLAQKQKEEEHLSRELQHEKELNEAAEALKKQEGMMQKYNHSKTTGVLTGAIAHEFNNLMTPIVLYSELFEENETVRQEMPEEAEELREAAERCSELARQLLDYSRMGRAEKVLSPYNATFAVESSISMMRRLVPENIRLETQITEKRYDICGQIGTLNQIILNLVTNAVHAIGDAKGVIRIQFGQSRDDAKMVRLIIEDDGPGIPEDIRRHIFEPFFTTKADKGGAGIGLTVVKRLVEEHQGFILVSGKAGKGTRFVMDFPRVDK